MKSNIAVSAAAAALVLMTGAAASAQTSAPIKAPNSSATAAANTTANPTSANQPLRQQVRNNLVQAGFTDITVMPTSFLVRAKDQSGNPVMMVINPDSLTEITTTNSNASAGSQNGNNAGTAQ